MTDSALRAQSSLSTSAAPSPLSGRLESNRSARQIVQSLVWKMAIATFILMAIGSATRVMNAGLACPDWPLCYGTLFPAQQMNLQVFLEWFHRLDAALIGVMAIALMGLSVWHRRSLPGWMPLASVLAFGLIAFQGILGGLTVTEMLRFDIVTAHLGTALLFFMTLLVIGILLIPAERLNTPGYAALSADSTPGRWLPWVSLGTAVLIYLQSLSGALVGSRWALHQCLNLSSLCTVMNSHLIGVIPATLATVTVVVMALRHRTLHPRLRVLAMAIAALLVTQLALGLATFKLHLQVEVLTVTHQSVGAALLGLLLSLSVVGMRMRRLSADASDSLQPS